MLPSTVLSDRSYGCQGIAEIHHLTFKQMTGD